MSKDTILFILFTVIHIAAEMERQQPLEPSTYNWNGIRRRSKYLEKPGAAETEQVDLDEWPLTSCCYDPLTMDAVHISKLLNQDTIYAENSSSWFLEYVYLDGDQAHQQRTTIHDSHNDGVFSESVRQSPLTVIHVSQKRRQNEVIPTTVVSVTRPIWHAILEKYDVLPSFVELSYSKNGSTFGFRLQNTRQDTLSIEKTSQSGDVFHMAYKLGTWPNAESAIYARHELGTGRTFVLLFGLISPEKMDRVMRLLQAKAGANGFHIVYSMLCESLDVVEKVRRQLEYRTRAHEAKTGFTTLDNIHDVEPVKPEQLEFKRDLTATTLYTDHIAGASKRVRLNLEAFVHHLDLFEDASRSFPMSKMEESALRAICNACDMKIALANSQYDLTQGLKARLAAQVDVTKTLMAQRDTQLNIEIAKAAQRDSQLVRGIAAVTMIFLPATFMATFFR